jgi:TolC family type I secretion outer membrane protein
MRRKNVARFGVIFTLVLSALSLMTTSPLASEWRTKDSISPDLTALEYLDMAAAQKIALAGNPSIEAAEERVRQARERINQARSAYWPWLDVSTSASRTYLSDADHEASLAAARRTNPFAEVDDEVDAYKAGLRLTLTLFNGFERKFTTMSAHFGEKQSVAARMETQRLLLSSVASSFFNALLARENIAIAEANKNFNQRQLKEAEARHQVGTGALSDVLNFKIRINSAEAALLNARRNYELTRIGLAVLMGLPHADLPAKMKLAKLEAETPEDLVPPDLEALVQYAYAHRPDIQRMEYVLKQAEANTGIAKAGHYPTIHLSASIDGDRQDDMEFEQEDFGTSAMMSLTFNLFAGGYHRAKTREAKAIRMESEKDLESVKINARSDVVSAFAELKSAQEELVLQRINADLVKQNRDLVEKEYAAGQTSLVRLNEAQRDLSTAQSRLVSALVAMRLSWENIRASTGEILMRYQDL